MEAADFFHDHGLQLVLQHSGLAAPFPDSYPVYLIVEVAGSDSLDELASALAEIGQVQDAAMAKSRAERHRLWALREGHTLAISAAGIPVKLDVAVPTARLEEFEDRVLETIRAHVPGAETVLFGHLVEGNVHVNILDVPDPDKELVTDAALRVM